MNGILPLFKPKGMTSHDCVMKIRRLLKMKKVGHTGTLDPEVEGVLPICLGEATKIIPFLKNSKTYRAEVYLGIATTTEDREGDIIEQKKVITPPSEEEITAVSNRFKGEIKQTPPMYSAVKVDGKKLYEYARQNIPVERPVRTVTIHDIQRIHHEDETDRLHTFRMEVNCSKGTYIRTLCVDIGACLGYPARMSYLLRTESDSFQLADTMTFTEIQDAIDAGHLDNLLFPIERALEHLPGMEVTEEVRRRVLHGQKLPAAEVNMDREPFKITYQNQILAIYQRHKENEFEIKPIRVFHTHKD